LELSLFKEAFWATARKDLTQNSSTIIGVIVNLSSDHSLFQRHWRDATYPEQQLPGVPQELGDPQQPPELGSVNFRDEPLDVL